MQRLKIARGQHVEAEYPSKSQNLDGWEEFKDRKSPWEVKRRNLFEPRRVLEAERSQRPSAAIGRELIKAERPQILELPNGSS
ncbi:hypothetical protein J6590_009014 [Homalodisca vitripennis]|nr:hypothetical protein J6590_009014 [Homalodisca vitripennis]